MKDDRELRPTRRRRPLWRAGQSETMPWLRKSPPRLEDALYGPEIVGEAVRTHMLYHPDAGDLVEPTCARQVAVVHHVDSTPALQAGRRDPLAASVA